MVTLKRTCSPQQSLWFDAGGVIENKPINQGFRLMHPGSSGQRPQQYSWFWWSSKEAKSEFLVLMEDAIRQPNLAKRVQRYQLAVDEAKVRVNLAVAPKSWLMPAKMIINTQSTVGYNNKLKQAVSGMKVGVNNEVNPDTKKAAVKNMEGGPSKINPPNSHPSNQIHKAATAEASTETRQAQLTAQKIEQRLQIKQRNTK